MDPSMLREELLLSLQEVYQLKAFSALGDLLQGEALILQYLAGHPGDTVYPSALSEALSLSRSRITGALSSLRKKGLVELEHSEEDRRRVQVTVTKAGLSCLGEKLGRLAAYFDRMIAGLGEEETKALISIIRHCVEVMQE